MICTLTARRLKPGSYEQFRSAWDPGSVPVGWTRVYHCRDVSDPDVVISFGLFDGTWTSCAKPSDDSAAASRSTESAPTWTRYCSMAPTRSSRSSARETRKRDGTDHVVQLLADARAGLTDSRQRRRSERETPGVRAS